MARQHNYDLTVIMPVYNEVNSLDTIIAKVRAVDINKQFIIVDDGSTDGSTEVLRKYKGDPDTIVLLNEKNQGKGGAIRSAFPHIEGKVTIIQDSDLETEPNDYLDLIKPIQDGHSNVVYGSRILGEKNGMAPNHSSVYYVGGKMVTQFANIILGTDLTDVNTCYKMMNSDLLKSLNLECNGFEFCTEVTAKLAKRKEKIVDLPMHYYPRTVAEGKKLQVWDGAIAIWTILKYRFLK